MQEHRTTESSTLCRNTEGPFRVEIKGEPRERAALLVAIGRKREAREKKERWNAYIRKYYQEESQTFQGREKHRLRRRLRYLLNREKEIADSKERHDRRKHLITYRTRRKVYARWYREDKSFGKNDYMVEVINKAGVISTVLKARRYPGKWDPDKWWREWFLKSFEELIAPEGR